MAFKETILGNVSAYILLQRAVGADRLRHHCLRRLDAKPGERILDVGCGPAYYLDHLPGVEYVGFDTSQRYIDYARQRFGPRGEFFCEEFGPRHVRDLPPFDAVLLMGLLHHLDDGACDALLSLLAEAIRPEGRVVTLDTAFTEDQGLISRWMARNDRGEFVRTPEAFRKLASQHFDDVRDFVVDDLTRVPGAYCVMELRSPRD